jgi:Rps23 Pro-64 3,4-dihydroxylase Tpa1-like proline 4-hydroxylase
MGINKFTSSLKALFGLDSVFDRPALIDYKKLELIAKQQSANYLGNSPFPHLVIDDFLEPAILRSVIAAFPAVDDLKWDAHEVISATGRLAQTKKFEFSLGKKDITTEMRLPPLLRYLLLELNSGTFLYFLRVLTGISGLISDPKMHGGGLHQTLTGGMLRVHADFSKHTVYRFDRRLNVLLFLNENWQENYGGNLELWSTDMSRCERQIAPIANRCVIFNTTQSSYHGYTKPITCPSNVSRKSIAMYYYTTPELVPGAVEAPTYWQDLPEELNP